MIRWPSGRIQPNRKAVIRIITIEREYGCGAAGIARELAARLGWKLWDQLLTEEIARFAHCDQSEIKRREERRDPLYYRLLKSFTLGSYEGNSSVYPVETLDADSIVKTSKRVVEEAAAGGECIIVGRGSQHFLRDRDNTLRFFLYGSKEEKIRRLISEGHKEADAQVLVDTVDRQRAAFIRKYFHADWPNRSLYHAMVNTDAGSETVIQAILSFLQGSDKGLRTSQSETERRFVAKRVVNP
jgi:cytidylate kinase